MKIINIMEEKCKGFPEVEFDKRLSRLYLPFLTVIVCGLLRTDFTPPTKDQLHSLQNGSFWYKQQY